MAEAALAMPQSGAGEEFFHAFPFEMAAACLYHITQNHPFVDGNKRTAFAVALTFLELNGYAVMGEEDEVEALTWKVASGKLHKNGAASSLEKIYNEHKTE